MSEPIVITGIGIVTPFGEDLQSLTAKVAAHEPTALPSVAVPGFASDPGCRFGAVIDPDPEEFLRDRKNLKYMDPLARLAVRAAGLAVRNASMALGAFDPYRVGIYMGIGFVASELKDLRPVLVAGRSHEGVFDPALIGDRCRINPISVFRSLPNIPACNVSIAMGFKGENSMLYPGAAQTAMAVDEALESLREGRCDVALAGGAAQAASFLTLHTLRMTGHLPGSQAACAPPCDGAAVLVLERESHAQQRGARALAMIEELTVASGEGWPYAAPMSDDHLVRVFDSAIGERAGDGGVAIPGDDGLHPMSERMEQALQRALGNHRDRWTRFSTRSNMGNATAANFPLDLALGLSLARTLKRTLVLVGAAGFGADAAACLVRSLS